MPAVVNFYLSRLLGNKVFTKNGKLLGKLTDLIVDINAIRPKVIAIQIKYKRTILVYDFADFLITKEKEAYTIICENPHKVTLSPHNTMMLSKHILDKQIVDINGRKLVRVNDIRLATISSGIYVIAVDIGGEGLLRRMGLARPLKKILKPFGINIQTKYIAWDEVETIADPRLDLKLSTPSAKLLTLHPSDLADIIEDLDKKTQAALFASLDEEKAADVLEELETPAQIHVLQSLPIGKAADVLEKMPADEVADILDDMQEEKAEELLSEMEQEASDEVKELMEYPDHTVGSIMSTDYLAFKTNLTVAETLHELRKLKPESDTIYYLYVVDEDDRLSGIVSLRDLVVSELNTSLEQIMNQDVIYVKDMDHINSLLDNISKYSLLAIPVVEQDDKLIGIVIINDIVYELLKSHKKRA